VAVAEALAVAVEAAVLAAAVAVAAVPVVGVREDTMAKQLARIGIITLAALAALAGAGTSGAADSVPASHASQKHFPTPDAAVDALVRADRSNDRTELLALLGAGGAGLISSGDPVADRTGRERFVAAFDEAHRIELEGPHTAVLIIGNAEWPLPISLTNGSAGWRFDTLAARQEILDRRIGRNELTVIEVCRAYVSAQREYLALEVGGQSEYAQRFVSTHDQHDGLYWPAQPGEPTSPLGPLVAQAQASGYTTGATVSEHAASQPYYGYYFRILTAQGPNAPGGERSYVVHGRMTGGFALVAYPASYKDSGIMTFIVNDHGIVFERNLGPGTLHIARQITAYDPDANWHIAAQ
jgi:hypothetical protein